MVAIVSAAVEKYVAVLLCAGGAVGEAGVVDVELMRSSI